MPSVLSMSVAAIVLRAMHSARSAETEATKDGSVSKTPMSVSLAAETNVSQEVPVMRNSPGECHWTHTKYTVSELLDYLHKDGFDDFLSGEQIMYYKSAPLDEYVNEEPQQVLDLNEEHRYYYQSSEEARENANKCFEKYPRKNLIRLWRHCIILRPGWAEHSEPKADVGCIVLSHTAKFEKHRDEFVVELKKENFITGNGTACSGPDKDGYDALTKKQAYISKEPKLECQEVYLSPRTTCKVIDEQTTDEHRKSCANAEVLPVGMKNEFCFVPSKSTESTECKP